MPAQHSFLSISLELCFALQLSGFARPAAALPETVEPRQRLDIRQAAHQRDVALTLDACGGAYDAELIATLVKLRVPATVFVTRQWLARNPQGLSELLAHPDLFELENHGAAHVPAVVGQTLYGMRGPADLAGVEREIQGGAQAVQQHTQRTARWYRGAGARYDAASLALIQRLNLQVAGYSLNADDGATASAKTVARRLRRAQAGDIILAHMNHPKSGTAEGLADALPDLLRRDLRWVRLSQSAGTAALPSAAPQARNAAPKAP